MQTQIAVAALACAMASAAPISAAEVTGDLTFSWRAVGASFTVGENHPYFAGSFAGVLTSADVTHPLNGAAIICPGYNDIGVDAAGYCMTTDKDGDVYYSKWSCAAAAPVPGTLAGCEGSATFSGGTGKYVKATGGDSFKAYTVHLLPDGTAVGYSVFTEFKLAY